MMTDRTRLHDEVEADEADLEIAQAEQERATFLDRLDENAAAGTEALRGVRGRDDGLPLNEGAADEYLAGRDLGGELDRTGVGRPMVERARCDGPTCQKRCCNDIRRIGIQPDITIEPGGSRSSSKIKKEKRRDTAADRAARFDNETAQRTGDRFGTTMTDEQRAREKLEQSRQRIDGTPIGRPPKFKEAMMRVQTRLEPSTVLALTEMTGKTNVRDAVVEIVKRGFPVPQTQATS